MSSAGDEPGEPVGAQPQDRWAREREQLQRERSAPLTPMLERDVVVGWAWLPAAALAPWLIHLVWREDRWLGVTVAMVGAALTAVAWRWLTGTRWAHTAVDLPVDHGREVLPYAGRTWPRVAPLLVLLVLAVVYATVVGGGAGFGVFPFVLGPLLGAALGHRVLGRREQAEGGRFLVAARSSALASSEVWWEPGPGDDEL